MVAVRNYSVFYGISACVGCRGNIIAPLGFGAKLVLHFAADYRACGDKFLRLARIDKPRFRRGCSDGDVDFINRDFHAAAFCRVVVAIGHHFVFYGISTGICCRGNIIAPLGFGAKLILHFAADYRACGDKFLSAARIGKSFRSRRGNRCVRFRDNDFYLAVLRLFVVFVHRNGVLHGVFACVHGGGNGLAPATLSAYSVHHCACGYRAGLD